MVTWCGRSNLQTNTSKTREMTIDFRKEKSPVTPLMIKVSPIEIVDSFTFLGTIISLGLDWEASISSILKKAQQRVYFLCRLERFGLRREILLRFYRVVTESVLCFSLSVWFGSTTKNQRRRLSRAVKNAAHIAGCGLPSLGYVYL